jgi:flagellar assembly protein FliH
MSDAIIPEERLPAFRRWQLASFDRAPRKPDAAALEQAALAAEQARSAGYAAGYEQGRQRAEQEARQLQSLVLEMRAALANLDQTVADGLLSLAVDIARQMVAQALAVKPQLVMPVVEQAVRCVFQADDPIRVSVHPEDAVLLRSYVAGSPGKEWTIVEDASLQRGGCRVATRSTEVDATLSGRWRRVLASLGSTGEWVDP